MPVYYFYGLPSSANLVSSFKQVAVDQASAQAPISISQQTCNEVIATMMNAAAGHQLEYINLVGNPNCIVIPGPLGTGSD